MAFVVKINETNRDLAATVSTNVPSSVTCDARVALIPIFLLLVASGHDGDFNLVPDQIITRTLNDPCTNLCPLQACLKLLQLAVGYDYPPLPSFP